MNARRKFHLDRRNGKIMGVCAGIADYFNIDATLGVWRQWSSPCSAPFHGR